MLKKTALSVAAMLASMGILVVPTMADVSFCIAKPTPFRVQSLTSNEVGAVVATASNPGQPIIKSNNNYGHDTGAGGYWTSNTTKPAILAPGCYILSISAKASQPDAQNPWYCAADTVSQTPGNLDVTGTVAYSSTLNAIVASAYVLGPTSNVNTDARNINCPPRGQ